MVLEGEALYRNAVTAGALGFITFGWDAGVLGGVLLTTPFQEAVGVCLKIVCEMLKLMEAVPKHNHHLHDYFGVSAGFMARLYYHHRLWHEYG